MLFQTKSTVGLHSWIVRLPYTWAGGAAIARITLLADQQDQQEAPEDWRQRAVEVLTYVVKGATANLGHAVCEYNTLVWVRADRWQE